jgi:hypothetical protein
MRYSPPVIRPDSCRTTVNAMNSAFPETFFVVTNGLTARQHAPQLRWFDREDADVGQGIVLVRRTGGLHFREMLHLDAMSRDEEYDGSNGLGLRVALGRAGSAEPI